VNDLPQPSSFDFDPVADVYDRWYDTAEGRLFDKLEKEALRRLIGGTGAGIDLLEIGMGTGWWSSFFAELGYHVTGVDISPSMVSCAQAKKIPGAHFQTADAHGLPFAAASFYVAAALTSLEFTREPETVIREMVRCVKPHGALLLGVLNRDAPFNQARKKQGAGPYGAARMFTVRELKGMLAPFGRVCICGAAFPISMKLPGALATAADTIQAFCGGTSAAFLAVRVDL